MPRYPKPDDQKVTRTPLAFGWTQLPAGHDFCPPLPAHREWHPATITMWQELWAKPQASQWDQSGSSLHAYALMWDSVNTGKTAIQTVNAELRQIENRHGLDPKALLQLRWKLPAAGPDVEPNSAATDSPAMAAVRATREYPTVTAQQRKAVREALMAEAKAEGAA